MYPILFLLYFSIVASHLFYVAHTLHITNLANRYCNICNLTYRLPVLDAGRPLELYPTIL